MIPNCPVNLDDIKNANTIFGPGIYPIIRKMVRRQPNHVVSSYINILKDILQLHKTVPVVSEIMFVNGTEFLVSIFRYVRFNTVQYLGKRTTGNISKSLENINDVYYRREMYVEKLYMDREF